MAGTREGALRLRPWTCWRWAMFSISRLARRLYFRPVVLCVFWTDASCGRPVQRPWRVRPPPSCRMLERRSGAGCVPFPIFSHGQAAPIRARCPIPGVKKNSQGRCRMSGRLVPSLSAQTFFWFPEIHVRLAAACACRAGGCRDRGCALRSRARRWRPRPSASWSPLRRRASPPRPGSGPPALSDARLARAAGEEKGGRGATGSGNLPISPCIGPCLLNRRPAISQSYLPAPRYTVIKKAVAVS